MKFGKFEISDYFISATALVLIVFAVLFFSIRELEINERTKQLEIEREIVQMEKGEVEDE